MINKSVVSMKHKNIIVQFIKFNIVGLFNTAIDFGVFILLHSLGVYFLIAQIISYSCGTLNSFIMNKYWTFSKTESAGLSEIVKFLLVNIISLNTSLLMLYLFRFYFSVIIAKAFATIFSVIINFAGNKYWTFK